ncbi:hypothetical protein [Xanthomonas citri]|uniref:hypothetical protein n=1 Tax=Xanthomonas citri TaxID=346 RepID=UPI001CBE80C4|nr:hypothetical protein [Xanthomonas citri]
MHAKFFVENFLRNSVRQGVLIEITHHDASRFFACAAAFDRRRLALSVMSRMGKALAWLPGSVVQWRPSLMACAGAATL